MASPQIVTGDSRPYIISLKIDDAPFVIAPGADVVKVAIVSADRQTVLAPAVTILSSTTGSDWAASKIIFKPSRESTASIPPQAAALEVQVSFGGTDDWTWFIPALIVQGNIS